MRVTDRMFIADFLFGVGQGRERVNRLNSQLGAQKRILTASDDPGGTETLMRVDGALARLEGYANAVLSGRNAIGATGDVLNGITKALQEAGEIAAGAAGTSDPVMLGAFGQQIDQLLRAVIDFANTKYDGKYIFGGTNTDQPPFLLDDTVVPNSVTYRGNAIAREVQVGEGIRQVVAISGEEAFLAGGDVFSALISIRDTMRGGSAPTMLQLQALDGCELRVLESEGKAGTIGQILDSIGARLSSQKNQLLNLRSSTQDVDLAEIGIRLQYEQTMLEATLAAGAKIIPRSLMDFLI